MSDYSKAKAAARKDATKTCKKYARKTRRNTDRSILREFKAKGYFTCQGVIVGN